MEKRISISEFRSAVRVAQACNPLMVKRNKVRAKIEALAKEYKDYDTQIQALEAGIAQIMGVRVEQIVKKVIEPTGKTDATGRPLMQTKYLPTNLVSYDETHKQYVITLLGNDPVPPTTENVAGSDYEKDAESLETNEEVSEREDAEGEVFNF